MKKLRTFPVILSFILCFALFLEELRPILSVCGSTVAEAAEDVPELQSDGVVRPEELGEGLSRKSFEDMEGRRVTLRQPVMEVTEREVERDGTEVLPDVFRFIDPDTHEFYEGEGAELAKIDFEKDGKEGNAIGDITNPRYPMKGLTKGLLNGEQRYFSNFEKYMLLRQAWYYRSHAMDLAEKDELQKHPAADFIYGKISDEATAVTKRIVSDPIYRSPLTTGLYIVPGEVVTVTVRGLKEGQKVRLTTHQQDSLGYDGGYTEEADDSGYSGLISTEKYFRYWDKQLIAEAQRAYRDGDEPDYEQFDFRLQNQWKEQNQKVPCMGSIFDLEGDGTYKIGSIYGGPLFLQPTDSAVELEISGAVETPHFILGVTTKEEFETYLRDAPGLIATLDVENGMLVGYSEYMSACDDIEKIGYFWHSVFAINSSLNGRAYNYNITMAYDMHVPAGEAVALSSSFCAQPYQWFEACMNYQTLTTKGNWGTFHELGHVQAKTYGVNWGMCGSNCKEPCEGEVWNNTLIILMYALLCNMDSRLTPVEHGEFVHPFTAVERSMKLKERTNVTDYHELNTKGDAHFDQLSLYSTLIHSFGPEKFVDFFYTYKVDPSYCSEARADFIYRIALVDHVNIFKWINEYYYGNVEEGDFSEEQWQFLNTLPDFWPIAYRWANGIDGNETARKYEVDGKTDTVFDLSEGNILSPKEFSIVSVGDPLYGSIVYDQTSMRAVYTPPAKVTETDSFDIVVCTEGGRLVTLNVNFRLMYRGTSFAEVWNLDGNATPNQSVEAALTEIGDREPDRTEVSNAAGKASFTAGTKEREYYHIRFKFAATADGAHEFYLKADDASLVTFKRENETGEVLGELKTSSDSSNYTRNGVVSADLHAGECVFMDCRLVNWGGLGYLNIGVKFPGATAIVDIPSSNIINVSVTAEELEQADAFQGWQPRFLDSIKNTNIDYKPDKSGWQLLKYPVADTRETNGKDPQNLIDGNESTFYHTSYGSPVERPDNKDRTPFPHEYIIDCGSEQLFNYFEFVRRGNVNDPVKEYSLYAAPDGVDPLQEDGYVKLCENTVENTSTRRYREEFADRGVRYFKLVITKAQSDFTVLSEFYAGLTAELRQTVKPSNYEKSRNGFEENAANGKLTARNEGAEYVFEFFGTGFDIFADTAPGYGKATVYIDGVEAGVIDLSDELIFNKCVFRKSGLDAGTHTVRILTQSEAAFNISFLNVTYATPVEANDYPAVGGDYGGGEPLEFPAEWRTYVQDYKTLTSVRFTNEVPAGYEDSYVRLNNYIRVYRNAENASELAFVYTGRILSPMDCGSLFGGCICLKELELGNFDTSPMRSAVSMFHGCTALDELDLSGFNTDQAYCLSAMFEGCGALQTLDISGFDIHENTMLVRFFEGCGALSKIIVPAHLAGTIALPAQFVDHDSKTFTREITSENAGHVLSVHETHTFESFAGVEPTCTEAGRRAYDYCPCGEYRIDGESVSAESLTIPATGHHWGEWQIVEEPTAQTEGLRERVCECGQKEQETIPALGVSAEGGQTEQDTVSASDDPPDNVSIWLIVGILGGGLLIAAGLVTLLIVIKKKRQSEDGSK